MTKKFRNVLIGLCSCVALATSCISVAFSSDITAEAQENNVFEMVYGAGIRVSDPTGMRFKTKFSENYYEELTADDTDTQMFVSILPYADYIEYDTSGKDLAVWLDSYYGAGKYINIAMDPTKFYKVAEDGCYYGNAVISNIYLDNYHKEFVGVAYLRRGTEGNYTYEYTTDAITQEDNARSVFEVASKANMDEEDHAKYGASLELLIKNGLYGAYGVTYDKNTKTYSLNGNTYTSIEEVESVVKLEDATLSVENEALGVGENKQLTPALTYYDGALCNKDVFFTWSSSNPGVATVDENGKVAALAEGTTTITVQACGGLYTATCTVSVSKQAITDTNLFLAKGNAGMEAKNIGLAALDLSGKGIELQKLEKVTIDGAATSAYTIDGNVITFNDPAPGTHAIVLETAAVKYTMDVCFYGHGISTLADLETWRTSDVQAYTVLLSDIDAEAQTLATTDIWHGGILDGLGHTISNFTMKGGFVCAINGGGAIKNLQLVNFTQDCSFAGTDVVKSGVLCGENNNGTIENILLKGKLINVPSVDHYGLIQTTAHKNSVLRNVFAELTSDGTKNHYTGPWWHDAGYTISNVAIVFNASAYNHDYTEDQIRTYGSMDAFATTVDLSKWEGWTLKNGKFYMSEYENGTIVDTGKSFLVKSNGSLDSAATGTATINLADLGLNIPVVTSVLIDGNVFSNFSYNGNTLTLNDAPGGEHVYTLMVGVNGYTVSGCVYANGISTLADLEAWRTSDIAAYTVLLGDIDAEGQTLATTNIWHGGILDGLGHTISNFTMTTAFVYAINGGGAVKNLQLVNFTQDCSAYAWGNKMGVVCNENNGGAIENVLLKGKLINVPNGDHYGLISSTAGNNSVQRNIFADLTSDGTGNHYYGPWWKADNYTISNVSIIFTGKTYNEGYTEEQIRYYSSMDAFAANVDLTKWDGWTLKNGKFYMSEYNDLIIKDTNKSFLVKSNGSLNSSATGAATINLAELDLGISSVTSVLIDGEEFTNFSSDNGTLTLNDAPGGEHVYTLISNTVGYTLKGCVYANGISTLADLETWRTSDIQAYTVLLNDIDAQGQTLAATDIWRAGILDGLGHTISNFTITTGFVCAINSSGAIKNIQLVNFTQDCSSMSGNNKFGVVCGENNNGLIENVLLKGELINVPNGDHHGLIESTAHKNSVLRNVFAELVSDGTGNHYSGPWWHDNGYTISNVAIVFNASIYNHDYTADQIRSYGSMDEFAANVDLSKWEGWTLKDGKFYMSEYVDGSLVDTGKSFLVKSNGSLNSSATGTAVVNIAELGIPMVTSILIDGEEFTNFSVSGGNLTLNNAPGGEHAYIFMAGVNGYKVSGCVYANGISTLADLETWRTSDIAGYTVLLADIDAQGAELAASDVWHGGILDGLGHTISNFTMTTAFVFAINGGGAIKNIQLVNFIQDCSAYSWNNKMGVVCNENNGGTIENVLLKGSLVNMPNEDHYGLISSTAGNNSVMRNVFAELTSDGTRNHYTGPWWKGSGYTISNVAIVFNASAYNAEYTEDQIRSYGSMDAFAASVNLSKWEGWTLENGKFYMSEYDEISITETDKSFLVKSSAGQWDKTTKAATVNLSDLGLSIPSVSSILIDGEPFTNFSSNNGTLTLNDAPGGDHVYTLMYGSIGYKVNGCVYANGISTVAELEAWRTTESFWYTVLLNDIDYNGQTLTTNGENVIGLLDGRGYTISNFTHTTGFITKVFGSDSVIKNVSFKGVKHDVSNDAFKGYGLFGDDVQGTIENIYLEVSTINGSGEHYGVLTAQVSGVAKNIIVNITSSYAAIGHYIMGVNNATTLENVFGVYGAANLYRWHHNHGVEEYPKDFTYRTAKELVETNVRALMLGGYWKNTYDALEMDALNQGAQDVTDVEDNYIVKDGKTEYVIVVEDSNAEEYSIAALELYNLFYEATGIKLTFASSTVAEYTDEAKFIYLGNSDLSTGLGVDLNALGSQGFTIKTQGQSVFIIANPQGVLYGAYEFLHETLNFETYTKEMYTLNKNVKELALPDLDITQVPDVEYRMAFSGVQYADETSRRRMRTQNLGDIIINGGQAHNMLDTIVPFDEYYSTNSNWFSNKTYSWNDYQDTQLCYTAGGRGSSAYNAMLQVAYENVIALLAQDTNPNKIFMSLTQMDVNGKWCTCSGCQSVINTYGSNSATQILFINDLTSRVQTWIDNNQAGRKVQFLIFAYYDSIDAPTKGNLKLNDNVSVWIAPINDNYMLDVNASGNELGTTLNAWKDITNNFAVWAYNVYFGDYLVPYNTYGKIDQMIDACVANNTNLMWVQGNWNTTQNTGFDGLKGYLIAKLMWDSTLDVEQLTKDYFNAVYGAAASDMLTVYNEMKTELNRITNNGATSGIPSYTSWSLDYLKAQLDRMVTAIGKLDKSDANYQKYYDAIVCESISVRYIYEKKRGKTYSTSAWGSFDSETSRLGFTQKSEKDEL